MKLAAERRLSFRSTYLRWVFVNEGLRLGALSQGEWQRCQFPKESAKRWVSDSGKRLAIALGLKIAPHLKQ